LAEKADGFRRKVALAAGNFLVHIFLIKFKAACRVTD
jgi:hypothetical protein